MYILCEYISMLPMRYRYIVYIAYVYIIHTTYRYLKWMIKNIVEKTFKNKYLINSEKVSYNNRSLNNNLYINKCSIRWDITSQIS